MIASTTAQVIRMMQEGFSLYREHNPMRAYLISPPVKVPMHVFDALLEQGVIKEGPQVHNGNRFNLSLPCR